MQKKETVELTFFNVVSYWVEFTSVVHKEPYGKLEWLDDLRTLVFFLIVAESMS